MRRLILNTEHPDCEPLWLEDDGIFPNNPALPVLIYRQALPPDPERIEAIFAANRWPPAWRYTVFDFQHYHSTAHEVLGCFRGAAAIQLGGEQGPILDVATGDVIVLPAGTAHKAVRTRAAFCCVGAYPDGQDYDMCYGRPGERPGADERIAAVPLPEGDPVRGGGGPWSAAGG